ncbi:MAG: TlpA disulfide reductase family protein [Solirubrobacteraceae bacterium]
MGSLVLGIRVLLAAVFLAAGAGKLLDPAGSRRALGEFGVPARALGIAAVLLPLAEVLTAAALLPVQTAPWGALAALVLVLVFIAGIGRALARGEAPDCHCFGQIHSAPAGRGTLARNAVLAGLAGVVLWRGPGPSFGMWAEARTSAELVAVVATIAAVVLAATTLGLWRQRRTLRSALTKALEEIAALPPGLPVGTPAPTFALPDLDGEVITLESLCSRGLPVALIFMSTNCGGCHLLLPDLGRWQATLGDRVTLAVLSMGGVEENRPTFGEHGISDVMVQGDGLQEMNDYRVQVTPTAIVVNPDGTIGSAPAVGAVTIEPLVRVMLRRQAISPAAPARSPAV